MTAMLRVAASGDIATSDGIHPALRLAAGDVVVLGPDLRRRVRHATRMVSVRDAGQHSLWPVAVAAGSLGDGLPTTDIVVAADQILPLADGRGAPARYLIDGIAVRRLPPTGPVDIVELHLDAPLAVMAPDSALPGLIEAVAATRLPPAGHPEGTLDRVEHTRLGGWARDPARPGQPLLLSLEIDGTTRGLLLADRYREDLATAMNSGGHHGFRVNLAPALSRRDHHHVTLRRAWDRALVRGTAMLLQRAPPLEAALAALETLPPETRAQALSAALTAVGEAARG